MQSERLKRQAKLCAQEVTVFRHIWRGIEQLYRLLLLAVLLQQVILPLEAGQVRPYEVSSVTISFRDTYGDKIPSGLLTVFDASREKVLEARHKDGDVIDLPFGEYTAELLTDFKLLTLKHFAVSSPKTLLLIGGPTSFDDAPALKTSVALRLDLSRVAQCLGNQHLWAKLVGLYSDVHREQQVNRFGLAIFADLPEGLYLVVVMDGKTVRSSSSVVTSKTLVEVRPVLSPCG